MPWSERYRIRALGAIFFAILLVSACISPVPRFIYSLQPNQHARVGESLALFSDLPPRVLESLIIQTDRPDILKVARPGEAPVVQSGGRFNVSIKLFGIIPLRQISVQAVPEITVVPGGQSIGIMMHSAGVMVIGEAPVVNASGDECRPARVAGIRSGDLIMAINGHRVTSESEVRESIESLGQAQKTLTVTVKRGRHVITRHLDPVYCPETGRYRIGVLIRDSAAGVGTLTFYDPRTRSFGALGHTIVDSQTLRPVELAEGKIVPAEVMGIRPGERGQPGEKLGRFATGRRPAGNIIKNSTCGIFGRLDAPLENPLFAAPIPVGLLGQVKTGPARMLTVIDGQKIESFGLVIEKIRPESTHDGKGLVIRIVDQKLLDKSGGIIQGMSGSPIIQNGRFVGAVTHVFVNNPARGYGVPAQWMLEECGLLCGDDTAEHQTGQKTGDCRTAA